MSIRNKWSKAYFLDLGERVGATFVGALLGLITLSATTPVQWDNPAYLWPVLGVPTLVALLKGLVANVSDPDSGASLVPAPPGPEVHPENGYAVLGALGLGLVVLSVILLVLTLLKVVAISVIVIVVLFVVGLVLLFLDNRTGTGRRVL